jgi:hypothetical protein
MTSKNHQTVAFPTEGVGFANLKKEAPRPAPLPASGRSQLEDNDEALDQLAEKSGYGRRSQPAAKTRPVREKANDTLKVRVTPSLKEAITDHKNMHPGLTYTRIIELAWAAYKEKHADEYPDEFK